MGVRELVGDANGVPASEKVKKHWSTPFNFYTFFGKFSNDNWLATNSSVVLCGLSM